MQLKESAASRHFGGHTGGVRSHARGDAREGSDVDLLLLLDGPVDPVREILLMEPVTWPFSLAEDVVLSVVPVSTEDFDRGEGLFVNVVRREAVRVA